MIDFPIGHIAEKIKEIDPALELIQQWQTDGQRIVFTNGCFDLLHYGHLHYLASAKQLGDRLVIGLNSDQSVKNLKGPRRPIKAEMDRAMQLAALEFVDMVTVFDEETPFTMIQKIKPQLLVKGGDWLPEQIVGSDIVLADGGAVHSLPFLKGYSTTQIESQIIDIYLKQKS